ncbi:hypothetical protein PInf_011840 [Phytophthora infestans]|nr:hypothetical protein PInf_011840 [Phytophthora infestans]
MADRSTMWGGPMRRTSELSGRRHHDQQRLLVELELDDSLRSGMEHRDDRRPSSAGAIRHSRHVHPRYDHHNIAEARPRLQSRTPTERQMQQAHAKRLSSPHKLKKQVLGSRHTSTALHASQRVTRSSSLDKSPAQLVVESVQQNIHLRDQVMAHLQQELMGVLPLHRASHVEKNVPQRVVKLLNRMRSLSLAVVEAVVYLSSELGASSMITRSYEHEILEQDFYRYLLQMASSDTDATSSGLFCSASSSSSSLLKLLTQRLETFALQTQRYLPGWQVLPAARVAAALLHLMDLETRSNAVQMLPRYLQSHSGYRTHIHRPDETSHDYGTFGHDRIQRLDRQDSQAYFRDDESLQSDGSVLEAWTGSPAAKASDGRTLHKARASSLADEPQEKNTSKVPTPSSAWTELPSPKDQNSVRSDASRNSTTETDANVASTRLIPLLNTAAIAKSSSSLDKSGSQKKSRTAKATFADARVQMSQLNTPIVATTQTTSRSSSGRSVQDEEGRESSVSVIDVDVVPASNGENLNPVTEPSVLPRVTVEERLNRLVNAIETPVPDECEAEDIREAEPSDDNAYECDFEYSSDSALSSIAMALQMLPDFSLSSTESPRADEVSTLAETVPLIEPQGSAIVLLSNTTASNDYTTPTSTLLELGICVESSRTGRESVDQKVQTPTTQDDEYAYSSSTAISSIAMALSLLPGVSRGDIFSAPDVQVDADSLNTDRSLVSQVEGCSVEADEGLMGEISAISAHSNVSVELITQPIHLLPLAPRGYDLTSERTANSSSVSSRSMLSNLPPSAAADPKAGVEEEDSELNRIFSLCRDIQVAAFDMSHWVSQREVEEYIQSAAQPFSCLLGYASPTVQSVSKADNAPKYLERELKMLKRNIASWKRWVVGHKRAKVVVRRLVARRKIRMFVLDHHRRRKQARSYEENRRRLLAATRIQRNWRIFRHYMTVAQRQADFCAVHLTFHRARFFVGISRRRRRREDAKERIVRWWRRQRLLIKKKEQRYERIARERERRTRAFRDIQKFLKEILLRRKLKATQEMTKKILFKEQLKWTKARRDMERTMKLDSKHRIELIADMNARFADLDRKWKASEYDRLLLLTHHERVVQQQQQAVEVRKRRLAALKIQMFFRLCLLHEKLQRVEMEKRSYKFKFKEQLDTKEKLDVDSQQRIGKTRTQVRVLERKLDRMSREATHTDAQHRQMLQAHQERERISQERVARQKIKAFMDARTLCRRAERERRRLLLHQTQLQAEKTESEFMSSEDQLEQRRTAVSIACDLQQRLSEMETRSNALQAARNLLAVEKEEQARQAALVLEQSRVQASMHLIASWVSGRVQLSKLHKEQAAIRALAAHDLEQEKRHQRHAIEAKNSEISSIKATNLLHQRISQQRNHKTVELIQIQHKQKAALDKSIAERTRAQLVQIIIQLKLLTERESDRGISLGLASVAQLCKTQVHTFASEDEKSSAWSRFELASMLEKFKECGGDGSDVSESEDRNSNTSKRYAEELALVRFKRNGDDGFKANEREDTREESAKRIQTRWNKWHKEKQNAERERKEQTVAATRIQRRWRRRLCRRQYEKEKARKQKQKRETCAVKRIQRVWRCWRKRSVEKAEREQQEKEERAVAARIQHNWTAKLSRRNKQEAERKRHIGAQRIQGNWRRWRRQQEAKRARKREFRATVKGENPTGRRTISTGGTERNASSLTIQRTWGLRQHRRKMERQRVQHEQHMAALKIQTLWLKWHHEQEEELERERIRQEQDESSLKIQRSLGISHRRRKVIEMRLRHKQNLNALKIQKHWRRWRYLRLEQRTKGGDAGLQKRKRSSATTAFNQAGYELERQQKLETITERSYGQCVARAVKRYHQSRRQARAATKIEAVWKGWLYRGLYLQAVEAKHADDVRQYQLLISVLATKVQVCWRQWNVGIRQAKRAAAKSEELRLIQQAKALERKLIAAKRTLAAKRIQRALVSRRRLIATTGVSHRAVVERENEVELETAIDRVEERDAAVQSLIEEHTPTSIESQERNLQEPSIGEELEIVEPTEEPTDVSRDEEAQVDVVHSAVESTVDDWSHRLLPHILSRSVNQVLFCHEAATVLQKCVRGHQRRQQMHFHFQHSFTTSGGAANHEHFHFYFWRARAWLDWNVAKSSTAETNPNVSILRLRFDELLTRNLLQLFEPSNEYLTSEIQQVLHELASDAWHVVQSPVCMEHNTNPRPELRYHDVGELELPLSVKLMQHMEQQHAQTGRQQLLKVDTSVQERPVTSPRAQNAGTIFTAVEAASLEAATFLQQQGADLGALDPKTQRNAFHLLSFSKENHRSRAEVLDFLLTCGATINVNAVDCNGETPLMLYASLGHLEFMQKLLQHGADLRLTNNQGQNVLHRACQQDQVEICGFLQQLMLKDSIAETPIPETMASFVPTALTLHTPDKSGRYPLHYLAGMGFVECAKQLIVLTEANFEWNRLLHAHGDADGRTALHLAVLSHDVAMTAFLLTPGGGCDVHAVDELHRSAVHYAVDSNAALQLMTRLVQHGANVNVADERGDTPLHWAAFAGRATVTQTLLSLGADPTWSNCDWETPAQIAAAYGQLECMRLLLQAQRKAGAAEQEKLKRPASEKTALERLEEAVQELHQRQASMHSFRVDQDASPLVEQAQTGYWEELHQDVQLVEESGQFSSEDEQEFLFD